CTFLTMLRLPRFTLFPYTTLFRSLPLVVDRLQSLISAIETNNQVLGDKLIAGQEAFHAKSDVRQTALEQRSEALNQCLVSGHEIDRKSTRLNSSHVKISYAVFCLK